MDKNTFTEVDLYWFQKGDAAERANRFIERLLPLYNRAPSARKGVSLCVGWLFDAVLCFNGDIDAHIPTTQPPTYMKWTYRDLASLVSGLKEAAEARGITDFHVAISLLSSATMHYDDENSCEGWGGRTQEEKEKTHYNIKGRWFYEHPELTTERFGVYDFNVVINVPADEAICREPKPAYGAYFADKLTAFGRCVGIDAVVLRDGVFTPAYVRGNKKRYMPAAMRKEKTDAYINTFKRIKENYPGFIVIGYGSGTSSIEEMRSHGFDLEAVAASGYMDMWITQTWASAWQDYWPAHSLGYTFQLMNSLTNLAMLANTPCDHMFLVETFDAWEPWDSIHQYPDKVTWEIWAYSHACLRAKNGCHYSKGIYCSWMNRGETLIQEDTVLLISSVLVDAAADLHNQPIPGGYCVLYDRQGLIAEREKDASSGEEIDDWAAMLLKHGTPVLSMARSEDFADVEADGWIFPAFSNPGKTICAEVIKTIKSGKPVLFTGNAGLLPDPLKKFLAIKDKTVSKPSVMQTVRIKFPYDIKFGTEGLVLRGPFGSLSVGDEWEKILESDQGPLFVKYKSKNVFYWETPQWGTPYEMTLDNRSIGSPETYSYISEFLREAVKTPRMAPRDRNKPICFLYWRTGAETTCLFGNLETGVTGNSQFAVKGILDALGFEAINHDIFGLGLLKKAEVKPGAYEIGLPPHRMGMLTLK